MSSQPRLRSQRALATAPLRRSSSRRRTRTAAVTIATALAFLTIATTSVASTGTVYYDGVGNAAAGGTLFNGTFTGTFNDGLGRQVMFDLTSGSANSAIGDGALNGVTSGVAAARCEEHHKEVAVLQQRDDIPSIIQAGKIGMFGGHREAGESFLECVAREIREEISYAVPEDRFEYLASYDDADIDAGVGTLHGEFFILRDIPVDELVVTEGSLRIVRPDEIGSLTNSLTPIAKMLLKAALERDRELALSWKTTRPTGL